MILQDSWIHQIKWSLKSSLPGFSYVLVAEGLGEAGEAMIDTDYQCLSLDSLING